jgi:potassium-transporting ATPase potassium-binding subunit
MTGNAIVQYALYLVALVGLGYPLGLYMARVYTGESKVADRLLGPLQRLIYKACGVRAEEDMTWKRYGAALLVFNVLGVVVVYGLQRLQASLPLNPDGLPAVGPEVSFNTAVSFVTNTNWQTYGGETTMSYLTQMLGLTVQSFVSAATGMAVVVGHRPAHVPGVRRGMRRARGVAPSAAGAVTASVCRRRGARVNRSLAMMRERV